MFERPMSQDPAISVGVAAVLTLLWVVFLLVRYVLTDPPLIIMVCITAAIAAIPTGFLAHNWARATPKWKLVRDKMERSL